MKLVVPFAFACAVALCPGPAFAADEIGLSNDGVHWSPDLATPLFDPGFRWVPGDRETASFWVRNQSEDGARLEIVVLGDGIDSLMTTGDLSVTIGSENGGASSTMTTGRQLLSSRPVEAGETERIDVTIAFDSAATNQSQVKALDLRFEVRLTQSLAGSDDHSDDSDDGDDAGRVGVLPGTGGASWWLLPAGWLSVAAGWLAVLAVRRREASDV